MKKMFIILTVLTATLIQREIASAETHKPDAATDAKCINFLKAHKFGLATDGYQVASTAAASFSHITIRDGANELVYKVEMSSYGRTQKFRYIILNDKCDSLMSLGSLIDR